MSIQKKTQVLISTVMVASIGLLFTGIAIVIVRNNLHADVEAGKIAAKRVSEAIDDDLLELVRTAKDYGNWDDPYDYMNTGDPEFIEANVSTESLNNLGLNFLGFVNNENELIGYGSTNLLPGESQGFSLSPEKWLSVDTYGIDAKSGVFIQPEGGMMIAQAPVIKNDLSGTPRGKVILVRYLGSEYISSISKQTNTEVSILPVALAERDRFLAVYVRRLTYGETFPSHNVGLNTVNGYFLLKDLKGDPVYLVTTTIKSAFTQQAINDLYYVAITMLFLGIFVVLIVNLIVNRFFLRRIFSLEKNIRDIIDNPRAESRIPQDLQKDEISTISKSINSVLDNLQKTQEDYRTLVEHQGEGVVIVNEFDKISFANPASLSMLSTEKNNIIGRDIKDFMDQDSKDRILVQTRLRENGVSSSYEVNIIRENGSLLPVIISATPRCDPYGKFIGSYGVFRDISAIKNAQRVLHESEEKFRNLVEQSQVGIFLIDNNGYFIEWNHALEEITGFRKEEVLHQSFINIMNQAIPKEKLSPSIQNRMELIFRQLTSADTSVSERKAMDIQMVTKDNKQIVIDMNLFPIRYETSVRIGGMVYDRTEQFHLREVETKQQALLEYIREMATSLNTTLDFEHLLERMLTFASRVVPSDTGVIYLLDDHRLEVACTRGYSENGIPEYAIDKGLTLEELPILFEMYSSVSTLAVNDTSVDTRWTKLKPHDWVRSFIGTPLKVKNKVIGFLNLYSGTGNLYGPEDIERLQAFSDLTSTAIENARMYTELQQKADTDELTSLRNRRAFFELAGREVERAHRFNHPLSALMIDLDNFKKVNDNFGHPVGDQLLVAIADIFRNNLRNIDLAARYGGDEFIVLLPENNLESAKEVAQRLCKQIKTVSIDTPTGKARVGASIGVSTLSENNNQLTSLIEIADRALYHAKEYGRGRVVTSQG